MQINKQWLTTKDVADLLDVTVHAVRSWVAKGYITAIRTTPARQGRLLFSDVEIRRWMEERSTDDGEDEVLPKENGES